MDFSNLHSFPGQIPVNEGKQNWPETFQCRSWIGDFVVNPRNKNEIIFFGRTTKREIRIYIYSMTENVYTLINDDRFKPDDVRTNCVFFCETLKSIILLSKKYQGNHVTVYKVNLSHVYPSNKKSFNYDKDLFNNVETFRNTDADCINYQALLFKNWLIISGDNKHKQNDLLRIFKLNFNTTDSDKVDSEEKSSDDNCDVITLIKSIDLKQKYQAHGMILKCCDSKTNDIEILLFGGFHLNFNQSFLTVNISLGDDPDSISYSIKKVNDEFENNLSDCFGNFYDSPYRSFGHNYINGRYLCIIGGSTANIYKKWRDHNGILCFDFLEKKWEVSKYILPDGYRDHFAVFNQNTGAMHIFAIMNQTTDIIHHWKINVHSPIEWKIERLIWIGYYQNSQNDKCLIKQLPKDIIKTMLSFLIDSMFL